jgi:hypothetical protein
MLTTPDTLAATVTLLSAEARKRTTPFPVSAIHMAPLALTTTSLGLLRRAVRRGASFTKPHTTPAPTYVDITVPLSRRTTQLDCCTQYTMPP